MLAAAIRERAPDLVVLENTTAGYDLGAAAAAVTGLPFAGYCLELSLQNGEAEATSAIYGGQLQATLRVPLPAVFSINSTALHEEPQAAGRGERSSSRRRPSSTASRRRSSRRSRPPTRASTSRRRRRSSAWAVASAGPRTSIAEELADALGAELAASRPVIDSGWLPKVRQVGKSGAHVTPKLYLALGVSGAPEHVEGMQGAELIVAVNTDPGAAIFQVAHYGVVADLFDFVDELTGFSS